jgi:type IV pilus assembly protein PilE
MKQGVRGFTLIEVIIALALVGILAAIAIPSYQSYLLRAKRSVAQRVLLDIANRQERYYLDQRTYTADLRALGYASSPTYIDSDGREVSSSNAERIYLVSVTAASPTAYTLSGKAQLGQIKDSGCPELTVDQAGRKLPSDCW